MDKYFDILAQQGLVGALLALALYAGYHLFRILREVQEKRVAEIKEQVKALTEMSRYVQDATHEIRDIAQHMHKTADTVLRIKE